MNFTLEIRQRGHKVKRIEVKDIPSMTIASLRLLWDVEQIFKTISELGLKVSIRLEED
jgi:hypothetical protein